MNPIKAFVGHSFLPEDREVVRAFTDYLTTLAESLPAFSWQDAERAEPSTLTEKVLRIARDKNLFIGICTSKESAVPTQSLSFTWPRRLYLKANIGQFSTKTSDWIIQEIGMAIGLGMKAIILQEKGIRIPGGLQGNTEYIEFSPTNPSAAFPKLLQMISSISPKETPASASVTSDDKGQEKIEDLQQEPAQIDFKTPNLDWDKRMYELAAFVAIREKDEATLQCIDVAFRKVAPTAKYDEKGWEAHLQWARIRFGFEGNLERLIELSTANPKNAKVKQELARSYAIYKERSLAAAAFVVAAELSVDDPKYRAQLLRDATRQYVLDRDFEGAKQAVNGIKDCIKKDAATEATFLEALGDLAKEEKDETLQVVALERVVETKPADIDARFTIGLRQSELGNHDLALRHYFSVPDSERSSAVWNNLGVEYDSFSLPAKAVDAFRHAADQSESLAMSNLGNRFANNGFMTEAKDLCDKALKLEEPDKKIHDLVARLADIPETEQQTVDEILLKSKTKSDFYRRVGRLLAEGDASDALLGTAWIDQDCFLKTSKDANIFQFSCTFERDEPALLGLLGALGHPYASQSTTSTQKIKHHVSYKGRFEGRAFFGTVQRRTDGRSALGDVPQENEVMMVLSADHQELEVVEAPRSTEPKYYSLRRSVLE
jgi:tetratricopeptide (TPR) repeat protein